MNPFAAMNDFFNNFMSWESNIVEVPTPGRTTTSTTEPQLQCPDCGYQLSTFRQNGRLGCTQCYESFRIVLDPLLASIHGNVQHIEEPPEKYDEVPLGKPHVEKTERVETASVFQLREKLKLAVQNEKFEEAAQIRDEIQKIKGNQNV
jgi:protein arginine kinase activator